MDTIKHFNVIFRESRYGWKISRETYIPNITESLKRYFTDSEIKMHARDCLINYDLNMKFFNKLNNENFKKELQYFLKKYSMFDKIEDLAETKGKSGYYLMVLGEYKQVYIGTGKDIYKRIRRHMSDNQDFDRLIFGDVYTSRLSINSFRPLDTTDIYIWYTGEEDLYKYEDELINYFSDKYVLNRTSGGKQEQGLFGAFCNIKTRNLYNN